MKIPKQIKIGGLWYKVEQVSRSAMSENIADTDFSFNLIRINKDNNKSQQDLSFLHEIIHCINNQLSEKETEFLTHSLYQVLHDNKLKF